MAHFYKVIQEDIKQAIPAIIFFIISFNLINLTERLLERAEDLSYTSYFKATIGALLVSKCLILVNTFPFINAFPKKPLIYNITWKFMVYGLAVFLFRVTEGFFHFWFFYENAGVACQAVLERLASPVFWAVQTWLFMLFIVYIVFSDLNEAIGSAKIKKILFG